MGRVPVTFDPSSKSLPDMLKSAARSLVPATMLGRLRLLRARRKYVGYSRETIFADVYENKVWGSSDERLFSGPGSLPDNVQPYTDLVSKFISEHGIKSVVDFGCGDFQVGRRL